MSTTTKTIVTRKCDRCGKQAEPTAELWSALKCQVSTRYLQGEIGPGCRDDIDLCESCSTGFLKWLADGAPR